MTRAEWSALKAAAESARAHRLDVVSSPAASPAAILRLVAHVERLEAVIASAVRWDDARQGRDEHGRVSVPESLSAVFARLRAALATEKEPDRG